MVYSEFEDFVILGNDSDTENNDDDNESNDDDNELSQPGFKMMCVGDITSLIDIILQAPTSALPWDTISLKKVTTTTEIQTAEFQICGIDFQTLEAYVKDKCEFIVLDDENESEGLQVWVNKYDTKEDGWSAALEHEIRQLELKRQLQQLKRRVITECLRTRDEFEFFVSNAQQMFRRFYHHLTCPRRQRV